MAPGVAGWRAVRPALSAPGKGADVTIVIGVNTGEYDPAHLPPRWPGRNRRFPAIAIDRAEGPRMVEAFGPAGAGLAAMR